VHFGGGGGGGSGGGGVKLPHHIAGWVCHALQFFPGPHVALLSQADDVSHWRQSHVLGSQR
jgi:hypothetical protein